ncbi:MAG: hypothetical protein ACREK7_04430 [Gemmatimonadota bacterium]
MQLRFLLPCLTCALFLVTCADNSDGPSGVGGPLEVAGGGCKDGPTNAAIDALDATLSGNTKSTVKGVLQTHCKNVETFKKNGDPLNAGLESFRAMKSIIVLQANITASQAIAIEQAFCGLNLSNSAFECPPWGQVPQGDFAAAGETFYDAVAVELATGTLNVATPQANLDGQDDGDDNFAISVQLEPGKTVAGAITIKEIASSFQGECHFDANSEFVCAGGIYEVSLFQEDDVVFATVESSQGLALAQEGPISTVGACDGTSIISDHEGDVVELPSATAPGGLVCDGLVVLRPSGLRGLAWDVNRFFGVTPAWAGRLGGGFTANSGFGGGAGLRGCTISGDVATTFDNNAEGVQLTVTDSDGAFVGSDTTDIAGHYDISFACPDQDGELYTILAEKQPGHPTFTDTETTTLPTVGGVPPVEVTTAEIDFSLVP